MIDYQGVRFRTLAVFSVSLPVPFTAWAKDHGINFKGVAGCWKDQPEQSFLVLADDMDAVISAGWLTDQESILYITAQQPVKNGKRHGWLQMVDGDRSVFLGELRRVTKEIAEKMGDYTYDPDGKSYWTFFDTEEARAAPSPAPGSLKVHGDAGPGARAFANEQNWVA